MTSSEFTAFLQKAFENLVAHSVDGSIHFVCMDWRHERVDRRGEAPFGDPKIYASGSRTMAAWGRFIARATS